MLQSSLFVVTFPCSLLLIPNAIVIINLLILVYNSEIVHSVIVTFAIQGCTFESIVNNPTVVKQSICLTVVKSNVRQKINSRKALIEIL